MERKAHLLFKCFIYSFLISFFGCAENEKKNSIDIYKKVDISKIPNSTISDQSKSLELRNGVYYVDNDPYSGFIQSFYENDSIKKVASYYLGKQHGATHSFYPNGTVESIRNYKNGIGYGRHFGYWQNGNMRFDFTYINDKREGIQKQWYESGRPYNELIFTNDRENGMQKAWRENGKPYINYEVKDGIRYGLQKAALCYTLKDEKLK